MVILIDQDGPLADETTHLFRVFSERFPEEAQRHSGKRTHFELVNNFPPHLAEGIEEIRRSKGFYLGFPPIEEGLRAFREMLSLGHEVFICSAPLTSYTHCVQEKFEWVERHLGREFIKRLIITKDKTAVRGDILIDDKPQISGHLNPEWEHVIYDASYNQDVQEKRRVTWANWKEVLVA